MLGWNDFFERWFDESSELDLPEIINQIIKYSTNDSFLHPQIFCSNFIFFRVSHILWLIVCSDRVCQAKDEL